VPNWRTILGEINQDQALHAAASRSAQDTIRRKYLAKLHQHTGRNVIAYYSGWLSKPDVAQSEITDEDKNGFMMAVHGLDRTKGLDLFIHTPGGSIAATESIVDYLQQMFANDIRAIVPQIAMSAGTMMACSCRSILMATHSNLGPIDPQLRGIPAHGVVQEFKRAYREIKNEPRKIEVWRPILSQYRPTFLSQCENAIKWSDAFVETQLKSVMFAGDSQATKKARKIVKHLTDYRGNRTHNRHISRDECENVGLEIEKIESDPTLQDLILTVHHCYMHALMNTTSFKMIENHTGAALVKKIKQQVVAVPS